jgi:pimeloyl-ACP methyl ester carboxylesterase
VFARKTVGQIPDHLHEVLRGLKRKPALIGHSFGGLLVQILAGRGLASATLGDPAGASGPFSAPCALQVLQTVSVMPPRQGVHVFSASISVMFLSSS